MSAWADEQASFAAALIDPQLAVPAGVVGSTGDADVRRFSVYRNNVIVSLIEALKARFPVVRTLVGDEFFGAMAHVYVSQHLPRSPLMFCYGDELPAFIAAFEPARSVPYLADVGRLEVAWSESFHSAEAVALPVEGLRSIDPQHLAASTLRLHPSLRLLRSQFPVASIWAAHQPQAPSGSIDLEIAEDVLVSRPDSHVCLHRLPSGGHAFVRAISRGCSLEEAAVAAQNEHADQNERPGFDAGSHLLKLFAAGAVIGIDLPSEQT